MKSFLLRPINSLLIITFLSFISSGLSFGQSNQLNAVIPPSPRSQEFEKFINYKVSLYNGLPEININFYTIQLDGVNIPIGISYHASGIKYGQISGDVGLGWNLNPGYRISRTVHGRIDEAYGMPDMNNFPNGQTIGSYLSGFTSKYDHDRYLARYFVMSPGGDIPAVAASSNDYLDGQYDMFTIGLPDQGGNFIITDRQNRVTTMLDNATLNKINYTVADGTINGFNVTDGRGVQYKLGDNDQNNENLQVYINGAYRKYSSAWLLSEITTVFNNKINFQYQPIQESSEGMPAYSRTILEGDYEQHCGPSYYSSSDNKGATQQGTVNNYNTKILSAITTPSEQVTISRNSNGTVNAISIAKENGILFKKISFFYSQPAERIFLDSIQIAGADNIVVERYFFDYTSKDIRFRNYDCFGYIINDPGGDYRLANEYGRFDYSRVDGGPALPDYVMLAGLNKRAVPVSDVGMLSKITYPTGGKQYFSYASNQYEAIINGTAQIFSGGGFRISQISGDDVARGTTLTRNYYYGKGMRIIDPTNPRLFLNENVILAKFGCSNGDKIVSLRRTVQSSALNGELADAIAQPNTGWYNEVTEDYGTGKIVYKFNVANNNEATVYPTSEGGNYIYGGTLAVLKFPAYYVPSYNYWNRPFLTEKTVYKVENFVSTPVQKENYEYTMPVLSPGNNEFTGLKVSAFALGNQIGSSNSAIPLYDLYTNSGLQSTFNYGTYTITRGDILLSKKNVTDYDVLTGSELRTTLEYNYTAGNLIASEKVTNSKGEVHITNFKYPFNYTGITASDNISAGIKNMNNINMVVPVIEKSVYRSNTDGSNKRLLSSQFFSFKPTFPVPDKVFTTESAAPVTNFTESSVVGGAVTKNTAYKEQITLDQYDAKGNILQQSKTNDTKEAYVWGYNSRYPVAKVVGNDYSTVQQHVNQTMLDNALSYTEAQIRTELNKLRTNLPGALVSTYTYSPLIGVTSETNPAGQSTYYEYDSYGRLKLIRNNENNIIKQYDYKYKTAIAPLYFNVYKSQSFTRNDCGTAHGTAVTYEVPAGTYSSSVSQTDADSKAQNDININGQAYANKYGYCIIHYYNVEKSGLFVRNNCTGDSIGGRVEYVVAAGKHFSDISQADADQKADNDIIQNGQAYANATNGACLPPVYTKLRFENVVQTPTLTTGDVVVRFYSNSACTIPYSVTGSITINIKVVRTSTIDNINTETEESFNCSGSSQVLKSNTTLSERASQAPGAPATNYTFTLQDGYGYIVR
ncbi:DUF5977 domain-containing protein [Chitinophaga sp. YIM B06452]|uniref:DUF5977 domain-containing protein n=1 Tax=Chitinophaga sp. YIM B06452 TaxID=3082158 RepID=UPI0031FEF799